MTKNLLAPERVVLLLALVPYLRERGEVELAALAHTFEVPQKLMRELVEFLGTAGVPGETGTYQHDDLFDLDWAALDEGWVRLTRTVGFEEAPRFSGGERLALLAGLHSLTPLLLESDLAVAQSAAEKLRVEPTSGAGVQIESLSVTPHPQTAELAQITRAIDEGRGLRFRYQDLSGTKSQRLVKPLALSEGGTGAVGGWYLRAYCFDRAAERTFMVDAMRDITLALEPASYDDEPTREPAAEAHPSTGRATTSVGAPVTAKVRVRERALHRIDEFVPVTVGSAQGTDSDKWVGTEVQLNHPGAAVRLVQAAPGDVIVDEPAAAREAVRSWAARVLTAAID